MDSLDELKLKIDKFNKARDWDQFHSPANLAKSIVIEAAELLECFQWNDEYNLDDVKDELADVINYCIQMSMVLDLDIKKIVNDKMLKNAKKYPISKSKGKADKYDKLVSNEEKIVKKSEEVKEEKSKKVVFSEKVEAKKEVKKVISEPKKEAAKAKKEEKPKKEEKVKGFSAYDSSYDKKFFYDITAKSLINNEKKYKDLTKKKLIDEIIKYYGSMNVIDYLLSEEELLFLKVNCKKTAKANDNQFRYLKDLMIFSENNGKLAVTTELMPVICDAIVQYKDKKDEIEAKKENAYLLVGIMRVYGALTNFEINKILSKYTTDEIGNFFELPYALRHVEYKDEYGTSYFALRDLGLDALALIETRGDNIRCNYSKKELIAIGKAYFNVHGGDYKAIAKNPKLIALLQKVDKEELIKAAGRGDETKVYIMDFYSNDDVDEKERTMVYNFVKSLPKYTK